MKYTALILFYLIFLHNSVALQLPDSISSEIERRVSSKINPSISLALLSEDGKVRYYNFGYADGANSPVNENTFFEIGSVTKTFTAFLAGKHFKNLEVHNLGEFYPAIAENNNTLNQINLADLRNHTAGVPRLSNQFNPSDWSDPFRGYKDSTFRAELNLLEVDSSQDWAYSNFGYGALGKAIESYTGKSFEKLLTNYFSLAGMSNSFLEHNKVPEEHFAEPTNIGTRNSYWHFEGPSRYAGGIITNITDLMKQLKFQIANNPLFQEDQITNLIPTGIDNLGKDQLFYKNGWFVLKPDPQTEILLHNGLTGGFTSFVAYNKSTKQGFVSLSNSMSMIDDIGLKLLYPHFPLNKPERTIAYHLAEAVDNNQAEDIVQLYKTLKGEGVTDNVLNTYWLERYYFGKKRYETSYQLSKIMLMVLPDDWEVHQIHGQNLEMLELYDESIEAYQKALELNPEAKALKKKIIEIRSTK